MHALTQHFTMHVASLLSCPQEHGHPATRYTMESGEVVSHQIFLFYVPPPAGTPVIGGKVAGTLCWCPRGERIQEPASSLSLTYLQTVLLKKNTPTMRHVSLDHVNKHRCFSLSASTPESGENLVAELNIELDSPEQTTAWLIGLYSLVTKGGMDAVLEEEAGKTPGKRAAKRFSIVAATAKTPAANTTTATTAAADAPSTLRSVLESGSVEDAINLMQAGTEFQSYENSASGVAVRTILLWFARDESRLGSLYWCISGGNKVQSAHRCMPLHEITDICEATRTRARTHRIEARAGANRVLECAPTLTFFCVLLPLLLSSPSDTGKQTRTFTAPESASAVSDLCWSLVGKHDILNLEASNKTSLTTWLVGLNAQVTRAGATMVMEAGAAPSTAERTQPIGARRFSLKPGTMSLLPTSQPAAPAAIAASEYPLLSSGYVFTCYLEKGGSVIRTKQFVFYTNDGDLGARICWCAPGFRVESELNRIMLRALTDVYVVSYTRRVGETWVAVFHLFPVF